MALRGQSRQPPRPVAEPQRPPHQGPPALPAGPVGVEQFLASAPGLHAQRRLEAPGPHWRLRWEAESLPAGEGLADALCQAVDRFGATGPGQDLGPMVAARGEDLLFFDTETLGLGNAGVFLIGWLGVAGGQVVVEQLFAQDYSEEAAILAAFAARARGRGVLVSYNGKSFDMPLLSCRAGMWQVDLAAAEHMDHVDLLYECRRRWAASLPDCRLQTVEAAVCGRRRSDDVPGWQIPAVYHEFVSQGDARPLGPILRHNMLDLVTMAQILLACLG